MRKFPVKRLTLSLSMLANVVAGDGIDPNGGQSPSSTPPPSGVGPAWDPNGGK